jgi:hypothetical protein
MKARWNMNRKTGLFFLQVFLVLGSIGCLVGSLGNQSQTDETVPDQATNGFVFWEQDHTYSIPISTGREELKNYREMYRMQITGKDDQGAPITVDQRYLIEVDKPKDARHETEDRQVPNPYLAGVNEWITLDGFDYYVHDSTQGGQICEKNPTPEDTSHYSEDHVTRTLLSITPGELLEEGVTVWGVLADVYEIKDVHLLFARQLDQVEGKVWIARQPRVFLKGEGEVAGEFEWENETYASSGMFRFELFDFDQVTVQLPVLCTHPPEETIPIPANATDIEKIPGHIFFSSPDDWDQVKDYYLNELANQGWNVEEVPASAFEQILQASTTTPQGIQLLIKVRLLNMPEGSQVQITWQVQ